LRVQTRTLHNAGLEQTVNERIETSSTT
jgi:hypothetical protein